MKHSIKKIISPALLRLGKTHQHGGIVNKLVFQTLKSLSIGAPKLWPCVKLSQVKKNTSMQRFEAMVRSPASLTIVVCSVLTEYTVYSFVLGSA